MKKLVFSAALALFATSFAMAQQLGHTQNDAAQFEQKRAERLKTMQSDLGLSDAQVAKIKELQEKRMQERKAMEPKMQAERKEKMEQMKAKREQHEAEMKQILTPEQFQKWQSQRKEMMLKRGPKMGDMQLNKTQVH
ncbi:MAG: hypothetical protein BGO40_12400 [Chryseobacterium sp. 39-10]|nr:hypothetical protein [Chryseobacterium sp.]OJV48618.1 MAG: hypothetical protein BGO40_12400 [Chryseobacterium sp. 39-10]